MDDYIRICLQYILFGVFGLNVLGLELEPQISIPNSTPELILILNELFSLAEPQIPYL